MTPHAKLRFIAPFEHVFKLSATLRVPGILRIDVENRSRAAAALAAQQGELQALLEQCKCQTWEAYERRQKEAEALGHNLEEVQAQIRALEHDELRANGSLTGLRLSLGGTASARQLENELARKSTTLSGILQRAGVSQPEGLRPLLEAFVRIEKLRARFQEELADALGGARPEEVKKLLEQAQHRVRELQDSLAATPNPGWTIVELDTRRKQLQLSLQKASKLEQELLTIGSKLSMLDSASLDGRRNSLTRDLVAAQAVIREYEQFHLAPADLLRIESEIASLEKKVRQDQVKLGTLQERAQREEGLLERKLRAEEEMDWLTRRGDIEQFRDEVDADLARLLARARERAVERLRRHLPELSARFLNIITEGRYQQMEGEGLQATVFSSEKGAALTESELSSGTADQLCLAKRFAALTALFDCKLPPLLLDDILVHSDSQRRAAILRLLKELASQTQILLFTCHEFPEYAGLPTLSLP